MNPELNSENKSNSEKWDNESFTDIFRNPDTSFIDAPGNPDNTPVNQNKEDKEFTPQDKINIISIMSFILSIMSLCGVCVLLVWAFSDTNTTQKAGNMNINRITYEDTKQKKKDTANIAQIAEKAQKSVVLITTKSTTITYNYFFQPTEKETEGAGSGVIISKDKNKLYILTNYHVIENSAAGITITLSDNKQYTATIKGFDKNNDIALISINLKDIKDKDSISIMNISKSSEINVGDSVIAIGNALGYGNSVTSGIISAKDREIQTDSGNKISVIQTDAAINPGNSGGALLDANGNLIGINTAKLSSDYVEGIGYAIPIDKAMKIVEDIINGKANDSNTGYLGIGGSDLDKEHAKAYGIEEGVIIQEVFEMSGAYIAGLQRGDIIVNINNKRVKNMKQLQDYLKNKHAGENVTLKIFRNTPAGYIEREIELTLNSSQQMP